ncbi:hypothetical protein DdX_17621 [Ditylenchus destructor]|uniref:Uncharacterized protein n=1 Tax=Ditylenchus destructor TaxID=166010 RepID=A0AAD4MMP6_9BILA|nr:hypothetical protein DdX_17621 [Ditylenchus destructor]
MHFPKILCSDPSERCMGGTCCKVPGMAPYMGWKCPEGTVYDGRKQMILIDSDSCIGYCVDPSQICTDGVCCQKTYGPFEGSDDGNDNSTGATTSNLQNQLSKIEDELQKMRTMLTG